MTICRPLFPTDILTAQQLALTPSYENILLAQNNPALQYDPTELKIATVLFNTIIPFLNLDNYPILKERIKNSGGTTTGITIYEPELADLLYESGISPYEFSETIIEGSPIPLEIEQINDFLEETDKIINDQIKGEVGGEIIKIDVDKITIRQENGSTKEIPIPAPVETTSPFTGFQTTVTDSNVQVTPEAGASFVTFESNLNVVDWEPSIKLSETLNILNNVYGESKLNYLSERMADQCKFGAPNVLVNMFTNLLGQVHDNTLFVSKVINAISSVPTQLNINITHILAEIAQPLQAAVEKIKLLAQTAFLRVQSIHREAERYVQNFVGKFGFIQSMSLFNQEFRKLAIFFSDFNVEMIRRHIKESAHILEKRLHPDTLAGSLPPITLDLVLKIMEYRSCKFSSLIDEMFKSITNEFKALKDRFIGSYNSILGYDLTQLNKMLMNGGLAIPSKIARDKSNEWAKQHNEKPDINDLTVLTPTNYITRDPDEFDFKKIDDGTSSSGIGSYVKFGSEIKNMGVQATTWYNSIKNSTSEDAMKMRGIWRDKENYEDAGWYEILHVNKLLFVKIYRVAERLSKQGIVSQLELKSAFRSQFYNQYRAVFQGETGISGNSPHMQRMALDIDDVKSGLNPKQTASLIKACSQEGFTRIDVHETFIHVDVRPGGRGDLVKSNRRANTFIDTAMTYHNRNKYNNG